MNALLWVSVVYNGASILISLTALALMSRGVFPPFGKYDDLVVAVERAFRYTGTFFLFVGLLSLVIA